MRTLLGWGILGQLIYVASQFVTLLALTRFASVQEVGLFGLASAVVIPVFFFFDLSIRVNVAASARSVYSFQDFRTLLAISVTLGFALVLVIGFSAFSGSALTILLILGATKSAECLSDLSYGVFQRFDRMHLVAGSLILRSIGGTVLFVVLLMNGVGVEWAFLAQFLVWAAVALGVDHLRARRLWRQEGAREGRDLARMLDLAKISLPLALNGLLSALQGNMPRYAIIWLLNVIALGQFTVVGYAMQAISTVTMAAMQSLTSRFSLFLDERRHSALRHALRKILIALVVFAFCAVGVSVVLGDWLIRAVFGAGYANLGNLLAICVLAATLRAVVLTLQMCLLAGRQYRRNLLIRVGSVLTMFLACLVGGILGGLNGIAWGMCLAFLVHISALALAVRGLLRHTDARGADHTPQP
ncbi:MAG: lipopolysaccharide biosynthesis protein [Rhodobacterales bacterium]|nr:lipopolysaccharide biosynthesis protein [Rhodobacterales bacterium]